MSHKKPPKSPKRKQAFTLIELLIVIALLTSLAGAVLVAVNPAKRLKQARDSQRKTDINSIANALVAYQTITGYYPGETFCDTSISSDGGACPPRRVLACWTGCNGAADGGFTSWIYYNLITQQQLLKRLPVDPINNTTYHYRYEPRSLAEAICGGTGTQNSSCRYWIGGRLEDPDDPTKPIFRCSDIEDLAAGTGCKEVQNFSL